MVWCRGLGVGDTIWVVLGVAEDAMLRELWMDAGGVLPAAELSQYDIIGKGVVVIIICWGSGKEVKGGGGGEGLLGEICLTEPCER